MAQSRERPPCDVIDGPMKDMIDAAWDLEADARPTFKQLADALRREEYQLPGTDRKTFKKYAKYVDRGVEALRERKRKRQAAWLYDLLRSETLTNDRLQAIRRMADGGDLSARLVLGLLLWNGILGPQNAGEALKTFNDNEHVGHVAFATRLMANCAGLYRGALAEGAGQVEEAAAAYKEDALVGDREAVLRYAGLLLSHGKEKEGLRLMKPLLDRGDLNAICTVGDYYYRWKNDKEKALAFYKRAATTENLVDAAPWFVVGSILIEQGKGAAARPYLERVVQIEEQGGRWAAYATELLEELD
jgi:TPR repeat protein